MNSQWRLTFKLFVFALIILLPTLLVAGWSSIQAFDYMSRLSVNADVDAALRNNIQVMQQLRPSLNEAESHQMMPLFERDLETMQAYGNLRQLLPQLAWEMKKHILFVLGLALVISFGLASFLAKNILNIFSGMSRQLREKDKQVATLSTLENWQNVSKSVIHELRAGLTPIKLVSSSLRPGLGETTDDARTIIEGEVKKMEELIESITAFARLPSAKLVASEFLETLDYFTAHFQIPGIQIQWDRPTGNFFVSHDPAMIHRLLFNLLRNSREANSEQKDLTFSLQVETGPQSIILYCRDNGRGFASTEVPSLFDEGYSSKKSKDATFKPGMSVNLGLGLAINKKIALEHNGDLTIVPSDEGACFALNIPRSEV